ncbi:MAG TPA: flagellar hook-basal body complex protein [Capillimicrobium sp.]|nr:flagellar hook-basal body complex protein [Capillimicrobium sp.]
MFSAISGLKAQQTMLDVTANNLANVNTLGFKASTTTFQDALSQLQRGGSAANAGGGFGGSNAIQVGLGVNVGAITNRMTGGAMQPTGNPLDVAISGDGWMRVGLSTAAPVAATPTTGVPGAAGMNYTRAGNFIRNNDGWMTTQDGYYVVGRNAATPAQDIFINIPAGATDVSIGSDGAVTFIPPATYTVPAGLPPVTNGRATAGWISLAKFPNEQALQRASGNRFLANGSSGTETVGKPGDIGYGTAAGGAIEMSNVDLATEFTNMIVAQRGFQANSRVISTGDQMLQDLVNLNR